MAYYSLLERFLFKKHGGNAEVSEGTNGVGMELRGVTSVFEKGIQKAILDYLKTLQGCFAWKEHGGPYGKSGIPDIICCYKGRFISFEVKRPGGKLTKLQDATLQRIRAAKGQAYKITSLKDVKEKLKNLEVDLNGDV